MQRCDPFVTFGCFTFECLETVRDFDGLLIIKVSDNPVFHFYSVLLIGRWILHTRAFLEHQVPKNQKDHPFQAFYQLLASRLFQVVILLS